MKIRGDQVTNVIDVRQSYPQKVVREAIRGLCHARAAENSVHFAYEMVALTPAAVRRLEQAQGLDFGLGEEDLARPFVEMSGRRGIGVKADALLATLVAEAEKAIAARLGDNDEAVALLNRAVADGWTAWLSFSQLTLNEDFAFVSMREYLPFAEYLKSKD